MVKITVCSRNHNGLLKCGKIESGIQLAVTPTSSLHYKLRFIELLLEQSITMGIAQRISVRLPSPSSFFVHKLLVASRWQRCTKREKDIRQAIAVSKYILTTDF
ncbi:MAG: hypothetical protein JSV89_00705 [Spirochaetaceae bacterium]|nr:MAG: hypothetical protein JSV89_00705 [Spirochaetaceae bacterium]